MLSLITYSMRNLRRRYTRTVMTCLGISLAVFASVIMMALSRGLYLRTSGTGEDSNILAISRNGQTVMFSSITDEEVVYLSSLEGLAKNANGDALVSAEIMHMSHVEVEGMQTKRKPVCIRGVRDVAYEVHKSLSVVEGTLPQKEYDILIGDMVFVRLGVDKAALKPGMKLKFEGQDWNICGIFQAEGSLFESEMWVKEQTLKTVLRRTTDTFAVVKLESPEKATQATGMFSQAGAYEKYFKGWVERGYYKQFGKTADWIFWLSLVMVVSIVVAGALIGINTMYTAIMNRMQELGTLRVLGFRKFDILLSLVMESMLLAFIGGAIGLAAGSFVNNIPMKFSSGAFYMIVDTPVILAGIALSAFIGLSGAILPAIKALKVPIMEALRQE